MAHLRAMVLQVHPRHPTLLLWYSKLSTEEVRKIAFEVALIGREGLDYSNPEKKYRLKSLPGESFSGLQMMCLMHAGFKRLAPDQDTGMDLHEPFLTALELFHNRAGKTQTEQG